MKDFMEEVGRRARRKPTSPVQEDVCDFAQMAYIQIKGGHTRRWVKLSAAMLVKSIAPNLSLEETRSAVVSIEGIALTVLSELFEEGTLIKKEAYKDEAQQQG